jgi:hypothetical protein
LHFFLKRRGGSGWCWFRIGRNRRHSRSRANRTARHGRDGRREALPPNDGTAETFRAGGCCDGSKGRIQVKRKFGHSLSEAKGHRATGNGRALRRTSCRPGRRRR